MSIELIKKAGKPHKYDAFCHCRKCEAYRKADADLNEMKFVGGWK